MGIDIVQFRHGETGLWELVGAFLCSREVLKELDGPIYSSEAVTWLVAVEDRMAVAFLTLRDTPATYWRDYAYTVPSRRSQGVHNQLAAACDAYLATLSPKPLRVLCRQRRWPHYAARGFVIEKQRGDWITIVRQP